MDVFNCSISTSSKIPPSFPFLNSKPSIPTLAKTNWSKSRRLHRQPDAKLAFQVYLPFRNHTIFRISAQFGRPTKRRNSLRKKLTDDLLQVRRNTQNLNFEDENGCSQSSSRASGLETDGDIASIGEIDSGDGNLGGREGIGESVLWNKLGGWVEEYKKDIKFWGVGSGPIFTVFRDLNGKVERVVVDEDEIIRRRGVSHSEFREERVLERFGEVDLRISYAKYVAEEMERGNNVLSESSSVAKFVVAGESTRLKSGIKGAVMQPNLILKVSRVGFVPVFGLLFIWAVKKLFQEDGNKELTIFEKEMMRRKMKSRMDKERLKKGSVEVVQDSIEQDTQILEKPRLDKELLMNSIRNAKDLNNQLAFLDVPTTRDIPSSNLEEKIQEIRKLARHAREMEKAGNLSVNQSSTDIEVAQQQEEEGLNTLNKFPLESSGKAKEVSGIEEREVNPEKLSCDAKVSQDNACEEERAVGIPNILTETVNEEEESNAHDEDSHYRLNLVDSTIASSVSQIESSPTRKMPRVICSIKEAREYLSNKHHRQFGDRNHWGIHVKESTDDFASERDGKEVVQNHMNKRLVNEDSLCEPSELVGISDASLISNACDELSIKGDECMHTATDGWNGKALATKISASNEGSSVCMNKNVDIEEKVIESFKSACSVWASDSNVNTDGCEKSELKQKDCSSAEINDLNMEIQDDIEQRTSAYKPANKKDATVDSNQSLDEGQKMPDTIRAVGSGDSDPTSAVIALDSFLLEEKQFCSMELNDSELVKNNKDEFLAPKASKNSEKSRDKLEIEQPSVNKGNWLEKNFDELMPVVEKIGAGFRNNYAVARENAWKGSDITELWSIMNDSELEWMNDDKLREIVFRVQDNELAGRAPFHLIDVEDKIAFFKGLEEKADKESEKLSALHEWLHSNIENLDYGADGISVYDPPEKTIPRWKGPPIDVLSQLLTKTAEKQMESSAEKSINSQSCNNLPLEQKFPSENSKPQVKVAKKSETVIESSDGSVRPGKRSGKEYWQHTKKWSKGFLEAYNAETDPEVKAVMKDIGRDLDRWITEEEIKKAGDLMGKLPRRRKEFVEKRLNKLKREVEQFGPQAVVSKYREYAVEEEDDYLWWLDLSYVLCIELYTHEGEGEELKVGFYTVEMATDLELDPKPNHVIAFEDPGDCKNLCYIIQSHLEMLSKGRAFVVAQPPKDAFREAKANGFGVTVIRKGELTLNVDQPLEEVEELISEIGSKMYHDKIMREHSIDIRSVMKGVFASSNVGKRKSPRRRKLKKPRKS